MSSVSNLYFISNLVEQVVTSQMIDYMNSNGLENKNQFAYNVGEIHGGLVVSKFSIKLRDITSVWVRLPQVTMLRTCPNITLAVERNIKPQF